MSLYNLVLQSNYYLIHLFTKCSPEVFYYSIETYLHNCCIAKDTGMFFPFNVFFKCIFLLYTPSVQHQILTLCKWNCPSRPILIYCSWRSVPRFDWYHAQGNRWSHYFTFFVWVCDPLSQMMKPSAFQIWVEQMHYGGRWYVRFGALCFSKQMSICQKT